MKYLTVELQSYQIFAQKSIINIILNMNFINNVNKKKIIVVPWD